MRVGGRIAGGPVVLIAVAAAALLGAAPEAGAAGSLGAAHAPDLPGRSDPALSRRAEASALSRPQLRRKLRRLARRAPGASGYRVDDLDAGSRRTLFDRNGERRRKLASNTKLFTTATALHRLGAEARIKTLVKARGAVNQRGRLKGKLFLIGAGDPSLSRSDLRRLARRVAAAGITKVTDGVAGDDSVFDRLRGVPDSGWGPSPYIAPLSGLVRDGSTYRHDPALDAAAAFRELLGKKGVRVRGRTRVKAAPARLAAKPALAAVSSPTIATLAEATNHVSNNFFAEMLLKRLWATPSRQGTTRGGAGAVRRFAKRRGSGINAKDGSGLTDGNRSSPREVVRLLAAMRGHREAAAFWRSLPVAGREGTLAGRMRGTAAEGRCRAKTGTIHGVSTLSGYCRTGAGTVAFSLLMNGVGSYDAARDIQDRMVVAISRYRG